MQDVGRRAYGVGDLSETSRLPSGVKANPQGVFNLYGSPLSGLPSFRRVRAEGCVRFGGQGAFLPHRAPLRGGGGVHAHAFSRPTREGADGKREGRRN